MMPSTDFIVIAHRGASSYAPENTLAAFELAWQMGARHFELDVHATSDGQVVVIHDDTVDRTTDGFGPVATQTLAALRALDAGSWFGPAFAGERMPTFAEVLARYAGRVHLHTEIKGQTPGLAEQTVDLIRAHGMTDRVTITSFQTSPLAAVHAYAPELPTGWLVKQVTPEILTQAHALGLRQLCPHADSVTPELVRTLHGEGFQVRAWGVGTAALMRQVVLAGADGMTVNFPDTCIAYLDSRQQPWA